MFIDEIKIEVVAGKGGNGMCSYRREKFIEFGGPWGGSGGKGGDIIFIGDSGLNTLSKFRYMKNIKGKNGSDGLSKGKTGSNGENIFVKVPLGTIFKNSDGQIIGEITNLTDSLTLAKGGKGGKGNIALSSRTNPTPKYSEKGDHGEKIQLFLELEVMADVGLIGFPSVGKSSIVKSISNAKTKVAAYEFTTLSPTLGVVDYDNVTFTVADLPGLIENAHKGVGLGDRFLRHLSRCKILIHVLDATSNDLENKYIKIRTELDLFDKDLLEKKELIVINKSDLLSKNMIEIIKSKFAKKILFTSSNTREGLDELIKECIYLLSVLPKKKKKLEIVKKITLNNDNEINVTKINNSSYSVEGILLKKLFLRADLNNFEGIKRFSKQMKEIGVDKALRDSGAKSGDSVNIYEYSFDFIDD